MTSIKRRLLLIAGTFGLIFIFSILTFSIQKEGDYSIVVGAKNDAEGNILSEIIAQLIENRTGLSVKRNFFLEGTFICFNAMQSGDIDLYVEYTGTAYSAILKRSTASKSSDEMLHELKKAYKENYDFVWLDPLGFQNLYVFLMDPVVARDLGIETLTDLSNAMLEESSPMLALDPEFCAREELELIEKGYGIALRGLPTLENSLLYLTLRSHVLDVINGYSTDGLAKGLFVLGDDKNTLPSYDAIPIIRRDTLEKFPQLRAIFKELERKVSEEKMRQMNYAVDVKGESIYNVAHTFLINESLL